MIDGMRILHPTFEFKDDRGSITELFDNHKIKSVTHTISKPNVLRGIHIAEWDRIVYPLKGKLFMRFLDVREDSPTHEQTFEVNQSAMKITFALFVPAGVGNSYCVVGKNPAHTVYFNFENFDQDRMHTVTYKDFDWPIEKPEVSTKDFETIVSYKKFKL